MAIRDWYNRGMNSSFGVLRSSLKWDPDVWRHYPDSEDDARFIEQLKRLRAPPSNLGAVKYMHCIAQGIRRQHRAGFFASQAQSAAFWDAVNAKPLVYVQRDDVPLVAVALKGMPSCASPVGAIAWAMHICNELDKAQRGRAFTTLPKPVDLWFSALQPWTKIGNALQKQPNLSGAPSWVQAYGTFLHTFEAGGTDAQRATEKFLEQLRQETGQEALDIAQRFVRQNLVGTHPAFHDAACGMLELLAASPRLSETPALFGLAGKLVESSPKCAARMVAALQPLVPSIPNRVGKSFLLETVATYWNRDDFYRVWHHFPLDIRREHASLVLDRICKAGVYANAAPPDSMEPLLDMQDSVWETIEQEIVALRPWPEEKMRQVALNMPATPWGVHLSTALDPRVEVVHGLVGDAWSSAWLQCIDAKIPQSEDIVGEVFESDIGL